MCHSARLGNKVKCVLAFFSILISDVKTQSLVGSFERKNIRVVYIYMLSIYQKKKKYCSCARVYCHVPLKEQYSELKYVQIVMADHIVTRLLTHISSTFHFVSYTQRVVGNGIKAQSGNPEVKVRGTDPVINQIIDKLKHVIQVSD